MFFPAYSDLKPQARSRLDGAQQAKRICLYFAALSVGSNALVVVISYLLDQQIGTTGGLANMGIRTLYTTIERFLQFARSVLFILLNFGFAAAMLRISRGMYTSPMTLKTGADRFGQVFRLTIAQSLLAIGVTTACFYAGTALFSISPFANQLTEALTPAVSGAEMTVEALMQNQAVVDAMTQAVPPILGFAALVFLIFGVPVLFRMRMAKFYLLDHPEMGALASIRASRMMLRKRVMKLFLLDLRMWWYYLALAISALVLYGDVLLGSFLGSMPLSPVVSYFVSVTLYLVMQGLIYYYLMPYVTTVYALCYGEICPKPKENPDGAILGSIFAE